MSQDNGARKDDAGKLPWSLLMNGAGLALKEIVKVLQFGARKYAPNAWQDVPNGYERYRDALYRHLHSIEQNGPWSRDEETGLLEWGHVGCNVLFLTYFVVTGKVGAEPEPKSIPVLRDIVSSHETPPALKQLFQRADGV